MVIQFAVPKEPQNWSFLEVQLCGPWFEQMSLLFTAREQQPASPIYDHNES